MEYVITSNGSSVFRLSDSKRIYAQDMTPDQVQRLLAFYKNYDCPMEAFIRGVPYTSTEYFEHPAYFGASPASVEYVRTTRQPVADMRAFAEEHKNEIEGINFILRDMESVSYTHLYAIWCRMAPKCENSGQQIFDLSLIHIY